MAPLAGLEYQHGKRLAVALETHLALKEYAQRHLLKMNPLANRIISEWLEEREREERERRIA